MDKHAARRIARLCAIGMGLITLLGAFAIANHLWPIVMAWAVCGLWAIVAIVACAGWLQAVRDRDFNSRQAQVWRVEALDLQRQIMKQRKQ